MGAGPNYLLYRPYHLCSIETPITAAQGVIYGESTAHPMDQLVSECLAVAKKDLKKGEVPDMIGECRYRASIEHARIAKEGNMLPVGLAKGAVWPPSGGCTAYVPSGRSPKGTDGMVGRHPAATRRPV
jgi:predicted homoserine dehydrogenase-like protein